MIARLCYKWTRAEKGDTYELALATKVLPSVEQPEGYRGAHLVREDRNSGTEFATRALFETLEAVQHSAREDYRAAVVPTEARELLARFDDRSQHYEIILTPP